MKERRMYEGKESDTWIIETKLEDNTNEIALFSGTNSFRRAEQFFKLLTIIDCE